MEGKITAKEFSQKYGIPYSTVHTASWDMYKPRRSGKEVWLDEAELLKSTIALIEKRRLNHKRRLEIAEQQLKSLKR